MADLRGPKRKFVGWRRVAERLLWATLCAALGGALLALAVSLALRSVPLPAALFTEQVPQLEFLDRNGRTLRCVRPEDQPFQRMLGYADIPQPLIQATLAAEDRRFWHHPGVDWRASLRAAWQMARHWRVVSGGSTITQQLIKLAEPRPRSLRSKLIEAAQALRLEQVWDKQRIMAAYLNRVDYGNFSRGCAAAAEFYFAKPLRDLSAAECALLAGLPQAPTRLNPYSHLARAIKRQQWVLGQMRAGAWLTEDEFQRATKEPLRLATPRRSFEAPHFIDLVLAMGEPCGAPQSLGRRQSSGASEAARAGQKAPEDWRSPDRWCGMARPEPIRTTLDLDLNHFAENTLRQHLSRLREQHVSNGAIVILDNQTGDVLALVGSENYLAPAAGQVNGAWALRSPGSALKPFTYLLAFERGGTPASVVADVPTEFATATGIFSPVNYNRHCYGPMRYRTALANSLNISAVKVLASIGGSEPLQDFLRQCGLSTLSHPAEAYGLGLTIGNAEVRLLELANAYACLARLGQYKPYRLMLDGPAPRIVAQVSKPAVSWVSNPQTSRRLTASRLEVGDTAGLETCATESNHATQVADSAAAYLIADILSDNNARKLAFGADSPLRFEFPVACKTGTSSDFRDNWAFGYTPEFTVGVWVGNFDGTPMQHISGVTGAAPLLHDLIEHLHSRYGTSWYSVPTNTVECWVHAITGKRLQQALLGPNLDAVKEKFVAPNVPPLESPGDYADAAPRNHDSEFAHKPVRSNPRRPVLLGSEYREWLASSDNWLSDRAVLACEQNALRIVFPLPGTTVYLDPDLPQQGRLLYLRADGPDHLEWHSDSLRLSHERDREVALLTEGRHQIIVRDPATGQSAQTWINVLAR
jgi:penicillin-binding protein 1C